MDYKEKYEQALDNLKKIKAANKDNKELVDFIEYQYTELKESENEIIRKELVRAFTVTADKREREIYGNGITYGQVLDWLEKQREQKPAWSEEDDKLHDYLLGELNASLKDYCGASYGDMVKAINWFKLFKQRMKGK